MSKREHLRKEEEEPSRRSCCFCVVSLTISGTDIVLGFQEAHSDGLLLQGARRPKLRESYEAFTTAQNETSLYCT